MENLPNEIINIIQSFLDTVSQSKWKRTNKYYYNTIIIKMLKREEKRKKRINRLRYFNPYLDFIEEYYKEIHKEEKEWYIYKSKNIIWDNMKNDDFIFTPEKIGSHPNISWEIIRECYRIDNNTYENEAEEDDEYLKNCINLYKNSFVGIESNPNITFDIIIDNIGKYFFDWDEISKNKNITEQIISQHFDKPWNYNKLSKNKNISIDFIAKNLNRDWDWNKISERITWNDFLNYPDLPWSYTYFNYNKNITWDIIKMNRHIFNDYEMISVNPNITWNIVKANIQKNWDFDALNDNDILPFEGLVSHLDEVSFVGKSGAISLEDIENNLNFSWNWKMGISQNPNLTREFFEKYKDKEWNYVLVLKTLYEKSYKKSYGNR